MVHPRRRRRSVVYAGSALLLLILGSLAWCLVRGYFARGHLALARVYVTRLETSLRAGDEQAARRHVTGAQREAVAARSMTSDPIWRLWSAVPRLGASFTVAGGLAAAAADLSTEVLPDLVTAGNELHPAHLRVAGNTLDTSRLVRAQAPLRRASKRTVEVLSGAERLPERFVLGVIADARRTFVAEMSGLEGSTRTASLAADLGPGLLGANGRRRYFLALQTNAESRATGGLLGAYGILETDRGTLRLTRLGSNGELRSTYPRPALDLGPEFTGRYRQFDSDAFWLNANMSPHFPYAARVWMALWAAQTGERLDGVLAVDPVAMASILEAAGPARLRDGTVVTRQNAVDLTERDVYRRYPDGRQRDLFLQHVARAVFDQLTSGAGDPTRLVDELAASAGTGHIQFAAANTQEQTRLATQPLSGVLADTPGPFLQVVTQDAGGSKLDYYLRRSVRYVLEPARADGSRVANITVRLRNNAPRAGLPSYVTARADLTPGASRTPGQLRSYLSVYGGVGAELLSAEVDGTTTTMQAHVERGHGVFSRFLTIDPQAEVVVRLRLVEPAAELRAVVVRQQPLVVPDTLLLSAK